MFDWLINNYQNIIVGGIIIFAVILVTVKLIKDKKFGKNSCGGNCTGCTMYGECNKKTENK